MLYGRMYKQGGGRVMPSQNYCSLFAIIMEVKNIELKTYILPGMGADSRMYSSPEYRRLKNIFFLNWPIYKGETTLSQMARRVIEENQITEGANIGGSSLGGMVACEIANQIKINSIILIGSSNTPERVNSILKSLSNFSEYAPVKLLQFLVGRTSLSKQSELLKMFEKAEHEFITKMSNAIFDWPGNLSQDVNIFAIHGKYDKVIYPPDNNVKIIGGGHLIAMSHPAEVASFIKESAKYNLNL
jgi:pimeloyl-ACP methyl ester carboxylesterase